MSNAGRAVVIHAPHHLELETRSTPEVGASQVLIRVHTGGICGSDLHYYHHGGFGVVRIKAPMILGHELSGTVVEVGAGVTSVKPGQRVAVNPSLPCGQCEQCKRGQRNHCTNMRFFGSAMRWPHVDGGFRDELVCEAEQAIPIADNVSFGEAALAEPLAVCLHAVRQAGELLGKRVLITGAGPIGALTVAAARLAGAADITITDVMAQPLTMAARLGADRTLDVGANREALTEEVARGGKFDVLLEASGSGPALSSALPELRAKGICVLIGQGAEISLQVSSLIGREIEMRGSFRFDREFQLAVDYLGKGLLPVKQVITATLPVDRVQEAFDLASDKNVSTKVQLDFA